VQGVEMQMFNVIKYDMKKNKKDAFYFPHFCNARNDEKIIKLRRVLGLEGYAIFFMLLETLREQSDFKLNFSSIEDLSYDWHTSKEKIYAVVNNFDLFENDGEKFFSSNLIYFLQPYLEKTARARWAASKRWTQVINALNINSLELKEEEKINANALQMHQETDANALQMHKKINANALHLQCKESKGKESKIKESKVKESKVNEREKINFSNVSEETWNIWIDYKKEQFKNKYKTTKSEQIAYNRLVALSNNDDAIARKIIEQSIANLWSGLFELRNFSRNNTNNLVSTMIKVDEKIKEDEERLLF